MDLGEVSGLVGAMASAAAAIAALAAVRWAAIQGRTARAALEASTQPIITAVPRPLRAEGDSDRHTSVSVGIYTGRDERPLYGAFVPIRNIGSGVALISAAWFRVGDGSYGGAPEVAALPPGEITRVGFMTEADVDGAAVPEAICALYEDFVLDVHYTDAHEATARQATLDVRNGETPHVQTSLLSMVPPSHGLRGESF